MYNGELFSQAVKQSWHEADLSPPSIAKIKNVCSFTSTAPETIMVLYLHTETNLPLHNDRNLRAIFRKEMLQFSSPLSISKENTKYR
jgi:hypothetical protein